MRADVHSYKIVKLRNVATISSSLTQVLPLVATQSDPATRLGATMITQLGTIIARSEKLRSSPYLVRTFRRSHFHLSTKAAIRPSWYVDTPFLP